jgi:hypothetical protein
MASEETPKVWVLDTSTKGTGATMVPLESTLVKPAPSRPRPRKPAPRPPKPPEPRKPPRFKVVDVLSGEVLAEGADGRATLDVLRGVRSVVDIQVYKWRTRDESWRLLTLGEQKSLWDLRNRPAA